MNKAKVSKKPVPKELKQHFEEQAKTDELNVQRHEQNIEAEKAEKKEQAEASATTQEKWEESQPKVVKMTKEEMKKIIAAYKIKNPVKYEQKKAVLEKRLSLLGR